MSGSGRDTRVRLVAALELGILGDALLRGEPWGISLLVCTVALAAAGTWLGRGDRTARGLLWAGALVAAGVAWRAAPALAAANLLAGLGLFALALVRQRGLRFPDATAGRYLLTGAGAIRDVAAGAAAPLVTAWRAGVGTSGLSRRVGAAAIGTVLAVPLLVVFGGLLASADPLFERLVRGLVDWDFEQVASHVVLTGAFTWLALGFLTGMGRHPTAGASTTGATPAGFVPRLGTVELAIPLGALALLFATFVALQVRYFFGGAAVVLTTPGLGYADYARRGFFELVTVALLVMPLLLAAEGSLDRSDARALRTFRWLAGALVGLVTLIGASAAHRLGLYFDAYGLTTARVQAGAVLVWVGLALAWFAPTVLRGRRGPFVAGAAAAALGVLACLNLLNPDAVVARVNVERARAGVELDVATLAGLSADGLPALARAARDLPDEARCELAEAVRERWGDRSPGDWRTWNLGRARARRAVPELISGCHREAAAPAH